MLNERDIEQKCQIIMQDMKNDIDVLKYQLNHVKLENFKRNTIKKLKIGVRSLQFVSPYVLIAGASFAGFSAIMKNVPFYRDIVPYYEHTRVEIDTFGNIAYQKQYEPFEDETNTLNYTGEWEKTENGFFERTLQTYTIPYLDYDRLVELFENENLSTHDVLVNIYALCNSSPDSNAESSIKEVRNNIESEDGSNSSFIDIVLYGEDKDNYIMREESSRTDSIYQLMYSFSTIIIEIIAATKTNGFNMDIYKWVEELNKRYQPVNEEKIKKELKIKLDNYSRLGGDSNEFSR